MTEPTATDVAFSLRPAVPDDAEAIAAMFTDEGYPAGPSDIVERLARFASPHSQVVVAERDGLLLGFVAFHAMPRFEHDDRFVRILALVVDAGVRERGVGRALIGDAERARCASRAPRSSRSRPATIGRKRASCTRRWATTRRSPHTCARSSDRAHAATRSGGDLAGFPRLRLRAGRGAPGPAVGAATRLVVGRGATASSFRELPVGPSRHLVRFLVVGRRRCTRSRRSRSTVAAARVRRPPPPGGRGAARGRRRRPGRAARRRRRRSSSPSTCAFSIQYRRLLMRFPLGPGAVPRPAARRDGLAPRRPPSGRRLLGRLLAREHAVPARRRPDPGVPRRRRDERGPPDRSRTASARTTSRSWSRTSASASPTWPRCQGRAGRRATTRSRPPRPSASAYARGVGRAPRSSRSCAGRPARDPGAAPAPQRPRLRGRRDRGSSRRPAARTGPPARRGRPTGASTRASSSG